jgi:hypothetical protein
MNTHFLLTARWFLRSFVCRSNHHVTKERQQRNEKCSTRQHRSPPSSLTPLSLLLLLIVRRASCSSGAPERNAACNIERIRCAAILVAACNSLHLRAATSAGDEGDCRRHSTASFRGARRSALSSLTPPLSSFSFVFIVLLSPFSPSFLSIDHRRSHQDESHSPANTLPSHKTRRHASPAHRRRRSTTNDRGDLRQDGAARCRAAAEGPHRGADQAGQLDGAHIAAAGGRRRHTFTASTMSSAAQAAVERSAITHDVLSVKPSSPQSCELWSAGHAAPHLQRQAAA